MIKNILYVTDNPVGVAPIVSWRGFAIRAFAVISALWHRLQIGAIFWEIPHHAYAWFGMTPVLVKERGLENGQCPVIPSVSEESLNPITE